MQTQTEQPSAFVGDGYDEEKFIRGVPRLYPDVRLVVRVMSQADRDQWLTQLANARPEQKAAITTDWMASRIVQWDIAGEPPSATSCGKLVPALYDRIFSVVWGVEGGDADDLGNSPAGCG